MNERSVMDLVLDFELARYRVAELANAKATADEASDALVKLLEANGVREAYHAGKVYSIEWRGPGQAEIATRPIEWLINLADAQIDEPDADPETPTPTPTPAYCDACESEVESLYGHICLGKAVPL